MVDATRVIVVGKCPENDSRRANLMKCPGIKEYDDCYEISFFWVDHAKQNVKEMSVTYRLIK